MITPPTLQEIYRAHAGFVWRVIRRSGLSEADSRDACQEVFLTVHRALPTFEGRSAMTTWLYAICRSVVRDWRKRAYRRYERVDSELAEDPGRESTLPPAEGEAQRLQILSTILGQISDAQREVFELAELEGLSGPEIAEMLNLPIGTVYSRLRLARDAFREACARFQASTRFVEQRAGGMR